MKTLFNDLKKIEGLIVKRDMPLARMTTFHIGGPASLALFPFTVSALETLLEYLDTRAISFHLLGNGSNLLVDDDGVDVVLSPAMLKDISFTSNIIKAGAGCCLMSLSAWAMRMEIGGFEAFAGIPASLGGAVRMNAGTPKASFSELVDSLLLTGPGGSSWIEMKAIDTGYRRCSLPEKTVVSDVKFKAVKEEKAPYPSLLSMREKRKIVKNTKKTLAHRYAKQPMGRPNAGSVFKNPSVEPAGRLLEICGLKGKSVGMAQISNIHANFIINLGHASSHDVTALMHIMQEQVNARTGIYLEPEIRIWSKAA